MYGSKPCDKKGSDTMMRRTATCLLAVGFLLIALPASADMFQHHTGQAEIEQKIVERPLVVGKGWVEMGIGFDWKHSASEFLPGDSAAMVGFTPGKHFDRFSNDARFDQRRFALDFRWGFTKGTDVYLHVPLVWNQLRNSNAGADGEAVNVNTFALGDMDMGLLIQWLRKVDPAGKFNSSLGSHLHIKAPTGLESPGSYIPSPGLITVMPTGTGQYNFGADIEFKQQLDFVAIDVRAGYTWRTTGIAQYLIEDDQHQFALRIDPGDGVYWSAIVMFQMARFLTLAVGADFEYRFATKIGPASRSLAACKECDPVEGSNGLYVNGVGTLSITPNRNFQVDVRFAYTLGGRPSYLIPLEDVTPTRGWTAGGSVMYRF